MPATPDELFAYLDSLGIAHQTVTHPPVFTVGEARELRGAVAGGHTKNLFLRDKKGSAYLVVATEDAAVELRSLHRLLGASGRLSFGSAELMGELLGVTRRLLDFLLTGPRCLGVLDHLCSVLLCEVGHELVTDKLPSSHVEAVRNK